MFCYRIRFKVGSLVKAVCEDSVIPRYYDPHKDYYVIATDPALASQATGDPESVQIVECLGPAITVAELTQKPSP